jgi:hypothetical protein
MKMIAKIAAAAGALALAGAAQAADMSSVFGNTIQITTANGLVVKLYMDANGAYSQLLPNGAQTKGTWADADGKICFTQTSPAPPAGTPANCVPSTAHKVGDTWTSTDSMGATSTVTIIAGR